MAVAEMQELPPSDAAADMDQWKTLFQEHVFPSMTCSSTKQRCHSLERVASRLSRSRLFSLVHRFAIILSYIALPKPFWSFLMHHLVMTLARYRDKASRNAVLAVLRAVLSSDAAFAVALLDAIRLELQSMTSVDGDVYVIME